MKHVPPPPDTTGRGVSPEHIGGPGTATPTLLIYRNEWMLTMIRTAFGVSASDIAGPGWMSTERYDIQAVVPEGATQEQVNVMLQNLLIDRFHLKFRLGTKMYPVHLLKVGKNGPKLKAATEEGLGPSPDDKYPTPPQTYRGTMMRPNNDGGVYVAGHFATATQLTRSLGGVRGSGQRIIDETGLTGLYDFRLVYLDDIPAKTPTTELIPTAAEAVEALGLKLEKAARPYPTIIVESADREPTEN